MELKSLLNKEQYEGAITIDGQLLILAGAGSGKTRVLTYRMAHMIEDMGIAPYNILAITFTNKAAKEMKDRVISLIGSKAENMWISTFHSTCVRILRREIDKIGYTSNFTIYDTSDQKVLIKECMKLLNINDKDISDQEILSKIGKAKDTMQTAQSFMRQNESNFREKKIAEAYEMYQRRLKENNALDFDDLIFKAVELFKSNPEVLDFYQNKFKYIMVDEYQDTNGAQYELIKLLASKYKNICVVGDDDQCIYQWRGADIQNILDFEKDYPNAKVIKLEQNYRSKSNILNAANVVIVNNANRKSKVLRTEQEAGDKIKIYRAFSDSDEGDFVSKQIAEIKSKENKEYKDFAILYRTNAQSRIFEESLRRRGIPYKIVGGTRFYDRKEIKDILAYLKAIVNPRDDVSLKRIINVPKRSIGDATVSKIQEFANSFELDMWDALMEVRTIPTLTPRNANNIEVFTNLMEEFMSLSETAPISILIESILKDTGYLKQLEASKEIEDKSRIENLKELVSDAVDFEKNNEDKSLAAYLEKVSLVQDTDKIEEQEDTIVLMTVHSAKGLEFPVVFMVGMENGIFPGNMSFEKESEMEESRRLCYVGITRAKETLFMTSAEVRRVFGRTVAYSQSDFINEIKPDLKEYVSGNRIGSGNGSNSNVKTQKNDSYNNPHSLRSTIRKEFSKPSNMSVNDNNSEYLNANEITLGRKIQHEKFGIGTIVSVQGSGDDKKLTIAFDKQGVKNLMLSFAKLKAI
ncbi:DNA helicase PcrA [Clostridium botulinum]|uniref:ATP-dependent DNA helicase n=1 Tax=Clostridium botulinum TaxID=1491 RepID=A0A0M1LZ10_CLOBO|nr:DNA helicase PcrA [Clostridium botulinum]ACD52091.1 ATP-dependent DNA helicase PcrA [Clostridium botulinum E3 str. Alaska E43]AJF28476.1 ATP-dependent DNA helicase PcrA [Clostridium botulinum]AJF31537.1 ATP-dependent DNA helicase PcrA [Clostridium botulinum]KAI3349916.1 DNA helicase PcrA [Clostridium botulinum]KOM86515.1 ATP-dependent DNA helicase PcrA [Clostridium botulinum]